MFRLTTHLCFCRSMFGSSVRTLSGRERRDLTWVGYETEVWMSEGSDTRSSKGDNFNGPDPGTNAVETLSLRHSLGPNFP